MTNYAEAVMGNLPKIRRYARFLSGRVCPTGHVDHDDLEQQSVLEQLTGRMSVSGPMLDLLRKEGFRLRGSYAQRVEFTPDLSAPGDDPEILYREKEARNRISSVVDRLPERSRFVIRMSYWEDLTLLEIGKRLGVNESRACQLRICALRMLKEVIQ